MFFYSQTRMHAQNLMVFLLNLLSLFGMALLIAYTGYGVTSLPAGMIRGSRSVHSDRREVEGEIEELERQIQEIEGRYEGREQAMPEFEVRHLNRLEQQARLLNRTRRNLEQSARSAINRLILCCRPFQVGKLLSRIITFRSWLLWLHVFHWCPIFATIIEVCSSTVAEVIVAGPVVVVVATAAVAEAPATVAATETETKAEAVAIMPLMFFTSAAPIFASIIEVSSSSNNNRTSSRNTGISSGNSSSNNNGASCSNSTSSQQ